jgi:undecaprenyl-diphosphatase
MNNFNQTLFDAVNSWPDSWGPILRFFSEATNYLGVKLFLIALVVAMAWRPGKARQAALQSLVAVGIANGMTDLLKHGLPWARPCQELTLARLHEIGCGPSMGTASAHSANMAAVAFIFTWYLRGWGVPWIVIALITGLSRVYVAAHYPGQVALGWLCGVIASGIVIGAARVIALQRKTVSSNGHAQDQSKP